MNINEFFNKTLSNNNKELKKIKKEMIDSYVIRYDNYQIGNITYKFLKENKYCTYIYVCNKDDTRSSLLERVFDNADECIEYSAYLKSLCDNGDLRKIYNLIK